MATPGTLVDQLDRERAFHDAHYGAVDLPPTLGQFLAHHAPVFTEPYWRSLHPGGVWADAAQEALRLARPAGGWQGARVLDVGSGTGYLALWLAHQGATVVGVELSPVGVEVARRAAARYGLGDRATFHAASAEAVPEPDRSFGVAVGLGVLHHLVKYPASAAELRRLLAPRGLAVFSESWHENPLLNLARRLTRYEEDAGDERLTMRAVTRWAGPHLTLCAARHRSLLYAAKRVVRHGPTLRILAALDRPLLAVPGVRRLGAEAVLVLAPPR